MITKKQIINYLESRGIKDKFEENHKREMAKMNGISGEASSLDTYITKFRDLVEAGYTTLDKLISGGFTWLLSPEGHFFWENEEREFEKWLKTFPEQDRAFSPVEVSPKVASLLKTTTPTAEEIYDIFKTFLEERGCSVEDFGFNMRTDYFRNKYKDTIALKKHIQDQLEKYGTVKNLIIHAFTYGDTPQGVSFWDEAHVDWFRFCTQNKI